MAEVGVLHERSHWLQNQIRRRVAELEKSGFDSEPTVKRLLTTLTDPAGDTREARQRHERTCDRCGTYVPASSPLGVAQEFYLASYETRTRGGLAVGLIVGWCGRCKQLEHGDLAPRPL